MRKTIRELRQERGWSQADLAHEIDVAPSTVYSWEAGRRWPHVLQLRKMAELFNVAMDDIDLAEIEGKVAA